MANKAVTHLWEVTLKDFTSFSRYHITSKTLNMVKLGEEIGQLIVREQKNFAEVLKLDTLRYMGKISS